MRAFFDVQFILIAREETIITQVLSALVELLFNVSLERIGVFRIISNRLVQK